MDFLQQGRDSAAQFAQLSNAEYRQALTQKHAQILDQLQREWTADLNRLGILAPVLTAQANGATDVKNKSLAYPTAEAAMPVALSKSFVESPILQRIRPGSGGQPAKGSQLFELEESDWAKLAEIYLPKSRVDSNSVALMREQQNHNDGEQRLRELVEAFEKSIARDSANNKYIHGRKIHQWLAEGDAPKNADELNKRVYAEIFLTPDEDPWLGFAPKDAYAALNGGGLN